MPYYSATTVLVTKVVFMIVLSTVVITVLKYGLDYLNDVLKQWLLLHEDTVVNSDKNPNKSMDVLIPTATTIMIENEYTILKNITDMPTTATFEKYPPTQVMSKLQTTAQPDATADIFKGILTQRIYEAGHANEELDIERLCPHGGNDLKLLIFITSAQLHAKERNAIRRTWAHYGTRRDVSTVFTLGRSMNESLNEALTQENIVYGDLVRGNFIDSFDNLTLKTVSALQWVDEHCSRAKYILKTDDDMFINVPKLLAFLDSHAKEKRVIYGRLAKKWKPIRDKKSKYYVSTEQFSALVFPPFTTGPAYVMSNDIVHDLYLGALHQVYLKLEDVFTTGIVAQQLGIVARQLGIKRVNVDEFLNRRRIAFNPRIVFNSCNIRLIISVMIDINTGEQFDLWKKLRQQCNSVVDSGQAQLPLLQQLTLNNNRKKTLHSVVSIQAASNENKILKNITAYPPSAATNNPMKKDQQTH